MIYIYLFVLLSISDLHTLCPVHLSVFVGVNSKTAKVPSEEMVTIPYWEEICDLRVGFLLKFLQNILGLTRKT